jgi:hypothetical protein
MEGNARIWFTPKQKAELWERWKGGQCVADIARDTVDLSQCASAITVHKVTFKFELTQSRR